ncbi:TrmB family transcriptional regulator [Halococcus agarilyticus]|uniref:TrmB family transcriptional regulator n=1 Tax=Halococcus agarilyticus TaxID=1232219 RepID=UPI0009AC0AEB|nr:helix-turn-helix domain-containing protein [Halococcus agarilyticus]
MTDHDDAVAALKRLGLSSYEAQVFIALQRVDSGTVRDVAQLTEVPRSQVYGAAEDLAERGLIDIQQSNPIQYRAVGIEEARTRLRERLEREEERAFEYIETARNERTAEAETQEDIWTVRGRDTITDRVKQLVAGADDRVVHGIRDPSTLSNGVLDALLTAADRGVDVTVVSANEEVRDRLADTPDVTVRAAPDTPEDQHNGRALVVDADTLLLSVHGGRNLEDHEAAIWSAETGFAAVLVSMLDVWLDMHLGDGVDR